MHQKITVFLFVKASGFKSFQVSLIWYQFPEIWLVPERGGGRRVCVGFRYSRTHSWIMSRYYFCFREQINHFHFSHSCNFRLFERSRSDHMSYSSNQCQNNYQCYQPLFPHLHCKILFLPLVTEVYLCAQHMHRSTMFFLVKIKTATIFPPPTTSSHLHAVFWH